MSLGPEGGRKVKRLMMLMMTGALMVALAATAAFAQPTNKITGTPQGDLIYGNYGDDIIVGQGGDDLLVGEAGLDGLIGGPGNDFLVTAYGYWQTPPPYAPASTDYVEGGPGHDLIDAADLAGARDIVYCGPGSDLVYAGVEDFVANDCEVVYRYFGF